MNTVLKMTVLGTMVILAGACSESGLPTPGEMGVIADHHLHTRSQAELDFMFSVSEQFDEDFRGPPLDPDMPVILADDLIAQLDAAGIQYGALLSSAYFFEFPEFDAAPGERRRRLEEANDFAAAQAARYPDRLRAFCSVNPLRDYAREEITRCAEELNTTGIKMHFGASDVNLRDEVQLVQLNSLFAHIRALNLPVVLHIRTRNPEFGGPDVQNFIQRVLAPNPGIQLQVAHMGSQGSYDSNTHEAMDVWVRALSTGVLPNEGTIAFDVSALVTRHPAPEYEQIAETIRRLGTERIYIGSDWPAFNEPRWVGINFANQVPLSEAEMADILDNVAPYFGIGQ